MPVELASFKILTWNQPPRSPWPLEAPISPYWQFLLISWVHPSPHVVP